VRRGLLAVVAAWFATCAQAVHPASAQLLQAGPPVYVYEMAQGGDYTFANATEPSLFNAATAAFGSGTPPTSDLLSSASTFGGSLGNPVDLTQPANLMSGTTQLACATSTDFLYQNNPYCDAAAGSVAGSTHEFIAVQSWPFYVDSGTASNVTPGTFTFETTSDDGSFLVLAPTAFTYAQPGNFQNATGLAAGTAVTNNGYVQQETSRTGTAAIAAAASGSTCASNLYWLTWEYFEVEGGSSLIEYSWQLPGAGARTAPTQGVVYGQVVKSGTGKSGETVSVSVNGGAATTLTTDVNGCYGYNLPSASSAASVSLTAKDTASGQTYTQIVSDASGNAVVQNFAFPLGPPNVTLYKRITKVVSGGVTTIPPPDSGNPTGVLGTVNYSAGVKSGDTITYTIYFDNAGTLSAQGATSAVGPTFSDAIPANTTLVAGSPAFTCCSYPTASTTATLTTGTSVTYAMNAPLAPATVAGSVQGSFSFSVTVN
jgi:uncharacterized repeat protein (TIGR01451 family)